MGILSRLTDSIRGNSGKSKRERGVQRVSMSGIRISPLSSNYENMFSQVRPLIDAMKMVRPYGVGRNGASLPKSRTPELNLLIEQPNQSMCGVDFMDAMFATWLTESELNVWVQKSAGNHVDAYAILPPGSRQRLAGENRFQVTWDDGETVTLGDDEVMTLRFSRLPRDIDKGLSPAGAVFFWTQIDDLMAQYQRAYLENGAIPASITFITASSKERYEAKRRELESGLKGAINKNKTIYAWRQLLDDNSTGDEIEVKTIQGNNSTLAIDQILNAVNDKLNKAVGVSNFILGDDSSAKYDNAELSDYQFTRRRVWPALTMFWSQFQFELDRIKQFKLGYGIQFDLDMPELTDQVKVRADTDAVHASTMIQLVQAGASPRAAAAALGLGEDWVTVGTGIMANTLRGQQPPESETTVTVDSVPMPTRTTDAETEIDWGDDEKIERQIYNVLIEVAEEIKNGRTPDADEVVQRIVDLLVQAGASGAEESTLAMGNLVGEIVEGASTELADFGWEASEEYVKHETERVAEIVKNYDKATQTAISEVLNTPNLTAQQIESQLAAVLPRKRAQMIARTEVVHAFRAAAQENDKAIADRYGLDLKFEWVARDDAETCPVCRAMNGTIVDAGESFPDQITLDDGTVVAWEHTHWNMDGQEPNAHPNCRCRYRRIVSRRGDG